jgi:hypothetical protein
MLKPNNKKQYNIKLVRLVAISLKERYTSLINPDTLTLQEP